MTMPPKRIEQHEIDMEACKVVSSLFGRTWELRDLTGRDFGIDKIAERFENEYATGELLLLQIKGTKHIIDNSNPLFSLDTKTLIYAEMFSTPFLLLYCSITEPQKCYYLWLQEYIRVKLSSDNTKWREQATNTVHFPKDNVLGSPKCASHLCYISKFPKYKDSWVEYYTAIEDLCVSLPRIYDKESDAIFIDKDEQNSCCLEIQRKLKNAATVIENIPKRFIPDCYFETIDLCKTVIESPTVLAPALIQKLIVNCSIIESSIVGISQRFNPRYLQKMFEIDGTADF